MQVRFAAVPNCVKLLLRIVDTRQASGVYEKIANGVSSNYRHVYPSWTKGILHTIRVNLLLLVYFLMNLLLNIFILLLPYTTSHILSIHSTSLILLTLLQFHSYFLSSYLFPIPKQSSNHYTQFNQNRSDAGMQRAAQILALMAQRKKENLGKFKTIQTQMCISACSEELVQGKTCPSGWLAGRLAVSLSL